MSLVLLLLTSCNREKHYQYSIVDDISGEQQAARVAVTDRYGSRLDIDGNPTEVEYLGKILVLYRWIVFCYFRYERYRD